MSELAQRRLDRLRAAMAGWGAEVLALGFGPDFLYLTGMEGPLYFGGTGSLKGHGDWVTLALVGLDHDPVIVLHPWFNVDVQTWVDDVRVLPAGADPDRFLAEVLGEFAPAGRTIAVGKTLWGQSVLALRAAAPEARFIPATATMMDRLRSIKDDEEIALMRRAAEIADAALAATVALLRPGMTEREVAIEVDDQIRRVGGNGSSFTPGIICVGNDSDPDRHIFTRNTGQTLDPGTTVAFDFGAIYRGYCSDFGRSVFIGDPLPDALAAYETITTGSRMLMAEMRAGAITPRQIADLMRDHVAAAGVGDHYLYEGLGHAIGLEVHEEPWLRPPYDEPIQTKMCFTIEPKIWHPGRFYVRCEDVVVVGPDGADCLNRAPYDPIVVT
jgi:Xaa-Pro aminopeptidase